MEAERVLLYKHQNYAIEELIWFGTNKSLEALTSEEKYREGGLRIWAMPLTNCEFG